MSMKFPVLMKFPVQHQPRNSLAAVVFLVIVAVGCSSGDVTSRAVASGGTNALTPAQSDSVNSEHLQRIEEMYRDYHREFADVKDVSADSLQAWLDRKEAVLVDVRRKDEIGVSQIPGSLTKKQYEEHQQEYAGLKIVPYCTIGYRSGKYAHKLGKEGVAVYNLAGGILAWVHHDGKLIDGDGSTTRVHVYGKQWNLLPIRYEPVW